MNYQTVRLVSTFGSSPKVETGAVSTFGLPQKWKLRTRFQFWAVSTFGPAQTSINVEFLELSQSFTFRIILGFMLFLELLSCIPNDDVSSSSEKLNPIQDKCALYRVLPCCAKWFCNRLMKPSDFWNNYIRHHLK